MKAWTHLPSFLKKIYVSGACRNYFCLQGVGLQGHCILMTSLNATCLHNGWSCAEGGGGLALLDTSHAPRTPFSNFHTCRKWRVTLLEVSGRHKAMTAGSFYLQFEIKLWWLDNNLKASLIRTCHKTRTKATYQKAQCKPSFLMT